MKSVPIAAYRGSGLSAAFIMWVALPILLLANEPRALATDLGPARQTYSNLTGQVVLENERVLVQKFTIQPGQATGNHARASDQLLVFIKGGVLTSTTTGRSSLWKDGRVVWQPATQERDEGSTNTGPAPIELICVTLKPVALEPVANAAAAPGGRPKYEYLNYPNIPGEDVLENDEVIVQRFVMNPGQWEGVHAHRPNTLYIFVKGGRWISRTKHQAQSASGDSPDGTVGWMPEIDISEGHESGNIGAKRSEVVWIALKK